MHQNWKKCAGLVLALALTASTLAGCGSTPENSSDTGSSSAGSNVSSSAGSSAAASGTGETGDEYDFSAGLTAEGYFDGVKALDYVKLPDYKSIQVPADVSTISDEDVQSKLDEIVDSYATTEQVKDRAVEDGDTVNIDYVGSVDGVEFEGGTTGGTGTDVTIGVTQYIDDFLEQLIGHKPGDSFDVNVTFPDPYQNNTDLSGKDAVFKTTINYIQEENKPELNDAFVAEHMSAEGWKTVAEAKEGVRAQLSQAASVEYLWGQISEKAEVSEIPEAVQTYHLNNMKNYYSTMAGQYGMEMDAFLTEQVGVESMEELIEKNQEQLNSNEKQSLVLQALCEDMGNVQATDEDLAAYFKDNLNVDDYSTYETQYGRPYLNMMVREDLARNKLGENA